MEHEEARQKHTACRGGNPGALFPRDVKQMYKKALWTEHKESSYLGRFATDSGLKAGLGGTSVKCVCQHTKKTFLIMEHLSICFKISSKMR